MDESSLEALCETGQQQLMRMEYLRAERTLAQAEQIAWDGRDYDALSRLYMPLQEARRQRRQRCGEGTIRFDLLAAGPDDPISGAGVIERLSRDGIVQGQFLIGGWGSIEPAIDARRIVADRGLYIDVLLGAVYPTGAGRLVAIVPTADVRLPEIKSTSIDALINSLPAHCVTSSVRELPSATYNSMMSIWERLHQPFLAAADAMPDAKHDQKIEAFRKTIRVDYACELAHQKLSDLARRVCRSMRD
jgi:hypothetical protein